MINFEFRILNYDAMKVGVLLHPKQLGMISAQRERREQVRCKQLADGVGLNNFLNFKISDNKSTSTSDLTIWQALPMQHSGPHTRFNGRRGG